MTLKGIHDNTCYDEGTLREVDARRWRVPWRRTITTFDSTWGNVYPTWAKTIAACKAFAALGGKNLVVFNTQAFGGAVDNFELMTQRLALFLQLAEGSVHAIEPGNELDTPGWTDSHGRAISDELIIDIGRWCGDLIARQFPDVICLSPSLLSGPEEGRFERVASGLAGWVKAMAVHPYYVGIGGTPNRPEHRGAYPPEQREGRWWYGDLGEKALVCQQRGAGLPTWFTELGCPTHWDRLSEAEQAVFVRNFSQWSHPAIEVAILFAAYDSVVPSGEMDEGKDWGLVDLHGRHKLASAALDGGVDLGGVVPPAGPQYVFQEGFARWAALEPQVLGRPLEMEFGPLPEVSAIRSTGGWTFWANLKAGPTYAHFGHDGSRRRWYDGWPQSEEIAPVSAWDGVRFEEGFARWAALEPAVLGEPLEREFGPTAGWSAIRTSTGWAFWLDLVTAPVLVHFAQDGVRRFWYEGQPASTVIPVPT